MLFAPTVLGRRSRDVFLRYPRDSLLVNGG
jgi:hypothetical protein